MNIHIKKLEMKQKNLDGELKDATGIYVVKKNDKEFKIICRFNEFGSTISLYGKKGTLHINEDTDQVVLQVVRLSDACGLNISEEPIEGLSATALRGIIFAEKDKSVKELLIKI